MYAIAFDLEQDTLSKTYGSPTYANAYSDIKKVLGQYGFTGQQGSVYFGDTSLGSLPACKIYVCCVLKTTMTSCLQSK